MPMSDATDGAGESGPLLEDIFDEPLRLEDGTLLDLVRTKPEPAAPKEEPQSYARLPDEVLDTIRKLSAQVEELKTKPSGKKIKELVYDDKGRIVRIIERPERLLVK